VVRGLNFVAINIPLDDVQTLELIHLVGLVYADVDATAQIPVLTAKHGLDPDAAPEKSSNGH
jgi:hypothetical protein